MNDRQRTEAILFPVFLLNILACGVNDQQSDEFLACRAQLHQAIEEALHGCDDKRKSSLLRRAARVHNDITASYRAEGVRVEKMALMALYCLQAVLDADYLVLVEGSDLAAAIDAVVNGLEHAFAEERLDASAKKQAGRMLLHLQELGYFHGVRREAA